MLTKTLQGLIERAERNGQAVKRVREGNIMGRYHYRIDPKNTPMVDQWRVTITKTNQDGVDYKNIIVDHYGTEIAWIIINETTGERSLHNYYGEGNSDRDALNGLMWYYDLPHKFTYRPSREGFQLANYHNVLQ